MVGPRRTPRVPGFWRTCCEDRFEREASISLRGRNDLAQRCQVPTLASRRAWFLCAATTRGLRRRNVLLVGSARAASCAESLSMIDASASSGSDPNVTGGSNGAFSLGSQVVAQTRSVRTMINESAERPSLNVETGWCRAERFVFTPYLLASVLHAASSVFVRPTAARAAPSTLLTRFLGARDTRVGPANLRCRRAPCEAHNSGNKVSLWQACSWLRTSLRSSLLS